MLIAVSQHSVHARIPSLVITLLCNTVIPLNVRLQRVDDMKAAMLLGGVGALLAAGFPDTADQLISTYTGVLGKLDALSASLSIYVAQARDPCPTALFLGSLGKSGCR